MSAAIYGLLVSVFRKQTGAQKCAGRCDFRKDNTVYPENFGDKVYATLSIPSIDMTAPVRLGTSEERLLYVVYETEIIAPDDGDRGRHFKLSEYSKKRKTLEHEWCI